MELANTNLTSGLDRVTRDFLQEHGDPETFVGDVTDLFLLNMVLQVQ